MHLGDVIEKHLIKVPLVSTDKRSVLTELVDTLANDKEYTPEKRKAILEAVFDRETLGSTGIGGGVAIPHAKLAWMKHLRLVVGISKNPIDFGSPDGELTRHLILVLAPADEAGAHVELLASIARTCSSPLMRKLLLSARSADEVYDLFADN